MSPVAANPVTMIKSFGLNPLSSIVASVSELYEMPDEQLNVVKTALIADSFRFHYGRPRDPEWQASNTLSVSIPDIRAEALAALLDHKHGIQVSLGSACSNNKSVSLSHVLTAIGLDEPTIKGTLRISLGQYTKEDDLSRFVTAVAECVAELRRIARTV